MVSSINKIVNKQYGKRDTRFDAVLKGLMDENAIFIKRRPNGIKISYS